MRKNLYPKFPVVLVDDEVHISQSFRTLLESDGITNIHAVHDSRGLLDYLSGQRVSVVVLDIRMPFISGDVLLGQIKEMMPDVPVIMVTASQEIDTVIGCMKTGATDYLVKPVERSRFVSAIRNSIELVDMRQEIASLREYLLGNRLKHPEVFQKMITRNAGMFSIFQYIEAIGPSKQPVLITGETGVGKELIARAVHELSGCKGEFIAVNTAGLDDTMFSDTLFGHVKGAFTGADRTREGMIHAASGGTLFLDEVGDMSAASQVKLLRLLQENIYFPLGSDLAKRSSTRVLAATNRDLSAAISEGRFRRDLYYRLCSHHVEIPPLRKRPEDIPLLLDIFVEEAACSLRKNRPSCSPDLPVLLSRYVFPGNIREMQSMVLDAVARNQSGLLSRADFTELLPEIPSVHPQPLPELSCSFNRFPTISEIEDYIIREALARSGGNKSAAASLLGITRQGLHKKLDRLDSQTSD